MKLLSFLAAGVGLRMANTQAVTCPDYSDYAQEYHPPFSTGRYNLSYQRPDPACRTVSSPAVDAAIVDMQSRIADPDLYRLFENSCRSTAEEVRC